MQYFQPNNRMLVISNDSFIVGLLTGYCVANNFKLKNISLTKFMDQLDINNGFKLIIVDIRELALPLINTQLDRLKQINTRYSIPVCAILNCDSRILCRLQPWVDYYQEDIFIKELDNYINKHLFQSNYRFIEQRNHNRRLGKDRRKIPGVINEVKAKSVTDNVSLIHQEIDNDVLGVFEIDKNCQTVFLKGKDLELTGKEYKLFNLLANHPKRVCTTDSIIKYLWPNRQRANKSDLYQYMHLLRRKVEKDPEKPRWIVTVKGVGYKLHVEG